MWKYLSMHRDSMTYYSHHIACCSVIWHSLHQIDCYEIIILCVCANQLPIPASPSTAAPRNNPPPARSVSWKYSQRSCFDEKPLWPNHHLVARCSPRNARSAAAARICRRANILRCVQVDARLTRRLLQMHLHCLPRPCATVEATWASKKKAHSNPSLEWRQCRQSGENSMQKYGITLQNGKGRSGGETHTWWDAWRGRRSSPAPSFSCWDWALHTAWAEHADW